MASDTVREQVIDALTAAYSQGRLTKQELDLRAGQAFAARTRAELAALTADLPAGPTRTQPVRKPAREQPRQSADKAVTWAAWGLITPALIAAIVAVPDPTPTDNQPIGKILFLVTVIYFMAWLGSRGHRCSAPGISSAPARQSAGISWSRVRQPWVNERPGDCFCP